MINNNSQHYYSLSYTFSGAGSRIHITKNIPSLEDITGKDKNDFGNVLLICDENTHYIAEKIRGGKAVPVVKLPSGEEYKTWSSIESILKKAKEQGLGRDSVFVGIGGGVLTDMAAFAASVYMRGVKVTLVSTSLLGMVDAAAGGKTGFDLFEIKNLVGTFYPADEIFMPLEALLSLPLKEWKSGTAELVKTAIIGNRQMLDGLFQNRHMLNPEGVRKMPELIADFIAKAVDIKCRIVENDPQEKGSGGRVLLNLGHTFGHALESSLGLGSVTHGEAVAWGIARSCELAPALGITEKQLCDHLIDVLKQFGFETRSPYPGMRDTEAFMEALMNDKKKKNGRLQFIIPDASGAQAVSLDTASIQLIREMLGNA